LVQLSIENKEHLASENIFDLKEFYIENIPEKLSGPKLSNINEDARKVIDEWTESGVWRE
jgi:hypothetical protein